MFHSKGLFRALFDCTSKTSVIETKIITIKPPKLEPGPKCIPPKNIIIPCGYLANENTRQGLRVNRSLNRTSDITITFNSPSNQIRERSPYNRAPFFYPSKRKYYS
jgi:hypothetical protein